MRRWLLSILEWRDHNLDIAPEPKFDGDAGGGGAEAGQAQTKLLFQCKKTDEMKRWNAQECETVQEDG